MLRQVAFLSLMTLPAHAEGTYICNELDRVSLSGEGAMRPVYENRQLNFSWGADGFTADGVFFHTSYDITPLGADGFRAMAVNEDRSDIFRFENGILMHAAIVKYGREPSIQSQVFQCGPAD